MGIFPQHNIALLQYHIFRHEGSDLSIIYSFDQDLKNLYIYMQLLRGITNIDYTEAKKHILNCKASQNNKEVMKTFESMAIRENDYDFFIKCNNLYSEKAFLYCLDNKLHAKREMVNKLALLNQKLSDESINYICENYNLLYMMTLIERLVIRKDKMEQILLDKITNSDAIESFIQMTKSDNPYNGYINYLINKKQKKICQGDYGLIKALVLHYTDELALSLIANYHLYTNKNKNTIDYSAARHPIHDDQSYDRLARAALEAELYDAALKLLFNTTEEYLDSLVNYLEQFNDKTKEFLKKNLSYIYTIRNEKMGIINDKEYKILFEDILIPKIILAIMRNESKMRNNIIAHDGTYGLMQVQRSGYIEYQKELNETKPYDSLLHDPLLSLKVGFYIFLQQFHILNKRLDQNMKNRDIALLIGMIFSYNAGSSHAIQMINENVKRYKEFKYKELLCNSNQWLSTRCYILKVLRAINYKDEETKYILREVFAFAKTIFNKDELLKIHYLINKKI